jgi:hypothetical protein
MLDSSEGICAGQSGFEYPATSVPFSKCSVGVQLSGLPTRSNSPITALIQAEMDRGKTGDTGHGRFLPYSSSAR